MRLREFLTVLTLGIFIGITIGSYLSDRKISRTVIPVYKQELEYAKKWNDKLVGSLVTLSEKTGKR